MSHLASLVLAATEAESSKAAFYISGGLLAAWAVAVSMFGVKSSNFPGTERASRAVIGISVVLVVVTLISSVVTS